MTTSNLILCNRTSPTGKGSRLNIIVPNIKCTVADLKTITSKSIDLPTGELELLYCGQRLIDDKTLDAHGIVAGVTVHVLRKLAVVRKVETPEPLDAHSIDQIATALQAALMNPSYRNTVTKMLEDPETMENIMAATPGLEDDPVAIAMLQDPIMLSMLADPSHVLKAIEAHPTLGQAAMLIAAAVNEEVSKGGATQASTSRFAYSLDQMSDDEDYLSPGSSSGGHSGSPSTITTGQLAAALASTSNTPQSSQGTPSSGGGSANISSDFFQQAMMQAAGGTPSSSTSGGGQSSSQPDTQAQLQQLRDMGITDENVARQALQATGGNLSAALELLFGDEAFS